MIGIDNGIVDNFTRLRSIRRMQTDAAKRERRAEIQRRTRQRKRGAEIPYQRNGPKSVKGCIKTQFLCTSCGALFIRANRSEGDPKKPQNPYCSRVCYYKATKGQSNPNYKGERPCRGCGTHVMGAQRVFCSSVCQSDHYKKCAEIRGPQNRLNRNMRRAVTRFLARGEKANRSWRSLTGFSSADLMDHLESQFANGMTWANYGSHWHLDHIKPVASFVFDRPEDQGFKDCWSLTNLQPLTVEENLKKSSNYNGKRVYRCR